MSATAQRLAALSEWIDASNADRDPEAITWGRIAKVSEECGEVIAAFIGATGQNPRKGVTHSGLDVIAELLDVAVTALGAVEHLRNHDGRSMDLLAAKVEAVCYRAGIEPRLDPLAATPQQDAIAAHVNAALERAAYDVQALGPNAVEIVRRGIVG
jgi:hypothetical protein